MVEENTHDSGGILARLARPASRPGLAPIAGGLALVWFGARRRTVPGWILALGGAGMVYRGVKARALVRDRKGLSAPGRHWEVRAAVTVARDATELYEFWRDLRNLPRILTHLEDVAMAEDENVSHWVGRFGRWRFRWTAELMRDEPGRIIVWRSLPGADVHNAGEVSFRPAPGGRGTEVHVHVVYRPAKGGDLVPMARLIERLNRHQLKYELTRFKQLMETGEIATAATGWVETKEGPKKLEPRSYIEKAQVEL